MTVLDEPTNSVGAGSPILYFVEETLASAVKIVAEVKIWFGAKASPPSATYTLTKVKDVNNKAIFNVGDLVNDFLTNETPSTYNGAIFEPNVNEAAWLSISFGYINTDNVYTPNVGFSSIVIATKGYGEFDQGLNVPLPIMLTSVKRQILDDRNRLLVAVNNDAASTLLKMKFVPDVGSNQEWTKVANKSEASNAILYCDISPALYDGLYKSSYTIQFLDDMDVVLDSIEVITENQCKYEVNTVQYVNRYGTWDTIPYNSKSMESSNVESFEYQNTDLGLAQSTTTLTYDTTKPQYNRYNFNTRRKLVLNTDLLDEGINIGIEQMLGSYYCYHHEKNIAINPVDNEFTKQEYVNRELVQYTHNFDIASSLQNRIV